MDAEIIIPTAPGVRVNVTVVVAKDNRDSGDHRPVISEIPHHMGSAHWAQMGGLVMEDLSNGQLVQKYSNLCQI